MPTNFAITGSTEIIQVAEAVAREKGINRDHIIEAMEEAVETVGKRKYGLEHDIRAKINQNTGEISLFRVRTVVEDVENNDTELSLKDAKHYKEDAKIGEELTEQLPPIDFGRVASQTFKQVMVNKVREAEREKQYEDFKDRIGEIVTGVVKRVEYGNVIIDFGKTETMLPRDQSIPREMYRPGDRIRAYIMDVRREQRGPQIFLSRTSPEFLTELFRQEVPEVYDGMVQIKGVARDPGSRAKVAVTSTDPSIDPVGACIGPRGSRVTAIYNELQGEKIDIIQWSPDLATLTVNALASKTKDSIVEVSRIVIDEDRNHIIAVVPDEQLSLAIGRRGQNVRLAADMLGWHIDVVSETEESEQRMDEMNRLTQMFAEALNVEEVIGQLLATEGFRTLEEVAYVPEEDLYAIEGFDEELVAELRQRALDYLEDKAEKLEARWKKLGVAAEISDLPGVTQELMVAFGEQQLKTLDDVADLASDEFLEIFPDCGLDTEEVNTLIMQARAHWFDDDPTEEVGKEEKIDEAGTPEQQSA